MRNGETNKIDLGSTLEEEDEKENGEGRMGRGGRGADRIGSDRTRSASARPVMD